MRVGTSMARWVTASLLAGAVAAGTMVAPSAAATPTAEPDPTRRATTVARPHTTGSIERPLDPTDPFGTTITVGYELYPARATPAQGTVLAIEGGPGYATTSSRDYYLDLFRPLARTHDVLLIDARGTGLSDALNCRRLQSYQGSYERAMRQCGRQLGPASDLYGSAFAADDMAAVLDHLDIDRVDVYGDSYGTFLGQTLAVRHPDRVRTLTLDAAYPVAGLNPWYPDTNRAMRHAFRVVCRRDRECRRLPGDPIRRLGKVADRVKREPLRGRAYDADGTRRQVRIDPGMLAYLMGTATYGTTVYQELDGAARTFLRTGDDRPLLRIAAEQNHYGGGGPVRDYSEAAYVAVTCNDYPQLWDRSASEAERRRQYERAVRRLHRDRPNVFAPFTVREWTTSPWSETSLCLPWPRPSDWTPPVAEPVTYPDTPTLVLVGELDSITSPEGARRVSRRFPEARFVQVPNLGHVTALTDHSFCASDIVVGFVRAGEVGDTSCIRGYPSVRTVDAFPQRLRGVTPDPGPEPRRVRRVSAAVATTVGDLFPRWFAMYGGEGRGLRGGRFTTTGLNRVGFTLHRLRFVNDLAVSGRVRWVRASGAATAEVTFRGAARGHLTLTWNTLDRRGQATARGRIGGEPVRLRITAP